MTALTHLDQQPARALRRITVMRGEARASGDADVEFNTVLGSCVSTCLFDPVARIGGMNHFLLAEPAFARTSCQVDEHYGAYLMELLINEMLARGASKPRLRARLFGGANMNANLRQIGSANALFAREFLKREGIALADCDLEGASARRVRFRPASGLVRCTRTDAQQAPTSSPTFPEPAARGDVELF
ncbi:chemotaxis protein CheD [Altererythrobacter lutimaris]|uniref:Probable chemoreceptor glutamine deamidase CheD n=1 Tax=Altererythrobacter lutimaris TaxID=2743979 RepID=A0A850HD76_9SPHN|nr:chemotaxis protein CheD [Altererythrobacter lutimaris]NVE95315.1 chemotaxis protein CheD [Altererythrobacter lutimaris]